jgi:hypothetical protein
MGIVDGKIPVFNPPCPPERDMDMAYEFDVFCSHNSRDKQAVEDR